MAFNVSVFKTRALTALIFVAVMLTGLLWRFESFFVLFSIIHFGCWVEYQKLIAKTDSGYASISSLQKYSVMLAGWCLMLFLIAPAYKIGNIALSEAGYWGGVFFGLALPIAGVLISRKFRLKNMMYSVLGLLYISLSWALLVNLRSRFDDNFSEGLSGKMYIIVLVASIWINDTMAYIVGSFIGKTPLTKISPKKTWEGTIGGIILSVIAMGLIGYFSTKKTETMHIMIVAAIASVVGTFGDILESKLKRTANVKDSGHIMPGHGGFLDRFDSLLLATPFVWACIILFFKS